ncbi:hypothetical protein FA95DRAFT_516217 [Auriscalpium vulgare]|uniref:Uncharacterized protein n=1 Tax=Auriscalpium vulgare TaxID=40419 RepID=A0ACB8RH42_9AGAM|nr:hypothetical protein FA95DRAFT_516217 [Auriscalpium vulgare]
MDRDSDSAKDSDPVIVRHNPTFYWPSFNSVQRYAYQVMERAYEDTGENPPIDPEKDKFSSDVNLQQPDSSKEIRLAIERRWYAYQILSSRELYEIYRTNDYTWPMPSSCGDKYTIPSLDNSYTALILQPTAPEYPPVNWAAPGSQDIGARMASASAPPQPTLRRTVEGYIVWLPYGEGIHTRIM